MSQPHCLLVQQWPETGKYRRGSFKLLH